MVVSLASAHSYGCSGILLSDLLPLTVFTFGIRVAEPQDLTCGSSIFEVNLGSGRLPLKKAKQYFCPYTSCREENLVLPASTCSLLYASQPATFYWTTLI